MLRALSLVILFFSHNAISGEAKKFGEPIKLKSQSSLAKVISQYDQYAKKTVQVVGEIEKVCQMKGCWLTLKSEGESLRVTFKNYGFTVPWILPAKKLRLKAR